MDEAQGATARQELDLTLGTLSRRLFRIRLERQAYIDGGLVGIFGLVIQSEAGPRRPAAVGSIDGASVSPEVRVFAAVADLRDELPIDFDRFDRLELPGLLRLSLGRDEAVDLGLDLLKTLDALAQLERLGGEAL